MAAHSDNGHVRPQHHGAAPGQRRATQTLRTSFVAYRPYAMLACSLVKFGPLASSRWQVEKLHGALMEIDHVFVFVEPKGADLEYLHALGLVETYRRAHAGQGTRNICFCFDNMFLECLWVSDVGEVQSDLVARTRLYERSQWRSAGTSPFGIAWRMTGDEAAFAPAMWAFRPQAAVRNTQRK